MPDKNKPITIQFNGDIANTLRELTQRLGLENEGKTVRKALALLMLSLGNKVEIKGDSRETWVVKDFKKAKPIKNPS